MGGSGAEGVGGSGGVTGDSDSVVVPEDVSPAELSEVVPLDVVLLVVPSEELSDGVLETVGGASVVLCVELVEPLE